MSEGMDPLEAAAQWCNDLFRSLKEGEWKDKVRQPGQREQLQAAIQERVIARDGKPATPDHLKLEIMRHLTARFPGLKPREIGEAYASGSVKIEDLKDKSD